MNINIISILAAFGLGSIITAMVQSWLQRKSYIDDRNFKERKYAYIGLLKAYHKAAVEPSDTNSKHYAYWQIRCDLVAPQNVRMAVAKIVATNVPTNGATNDDLNRRHKADEELILAIRRDLAVSKE